MRNNLYSLIKYAKSQNPDFQALLHECDDILYKSLWEYHLEGYEQARKLGLKADDPRFATPKTSLSNTCKTTTSAKIFINWLTV